MPIIQGMSNGGRLETVGYIGLKDGKIHSSSATDVNTMKGIAEAISKNEWLGRAYTGDLLKELGILEDLPYEYRKLYPK